MGWVFNFSFIRLFDWRVLQGYNHVFRFITISNEKARKILNIEIDMVLHEHRQHEAMSFLYGTLSVKTIDVASNFMVLYRLGHSL